MTTADKRGAEFRDAGFSAAEFGDAELPAAGKRAARPGIAIPRMVCGLFLPALALMPAAARAEPPKLPVPAVDQAAVGQRGYFYVGGKYAGQPGKEIMQGQAYVEVLAPRDVRRPYPLVLIHGAFQTATNWMGTPDGRKGWAKYFVEQGYVVHMIDQPVRGRSAAHPSDGPTRMATARPFGPTDIPIAYDPPTKDASELAVEREATADGPDLFVCWMQTAPARELVNLKNIPVMVMSAEASYHQVYDHCTAKYLNQAGGKTDHIRLQDKGLHGNGHMMMIEKNNLDIAHVVDEWILNNVR